MKGIRSEGQMEGMRCEGQMEGIRCEGQMEGKRCEGQMQEGRTEGICLLPFGHTGRKEAGMKKGKKERNGERRK